MLEVLTVHQRVQTSVAQVTAVTGESGQAWTQFHTESHLISNYKLLRYRFHSSVYKIDADLGVDVCRSPSAGDTGDHVDGEEGRTGSLVDEGQGAHRVLVEEVSQARMVAEKTAHSGLANSTLPDIEVA